MADRFGGPVLAFSRESKFRRIPYTDIKPSSQPQLVKGMLPRLGLAYVAGSRGTGKTFVVVDIGQRVACGAKVLGRVTKQVGVAYVSAEDAEGCKLRIMAWRENHPRGSYTPFELIDRAVNLLEPTDVDDLIATLLDADRTFQEHGHRLGLVVFDTQSRCLPGVEENSSEKMSAAVQELERIGRETQALTLVVTHHGKDAARGVRGWSGQEGAADAIISIVRDEVTNDRTIEFTKIKNGPDGQRIGFVLKPAPTSMVDDDGDPMDTCLVEFMELADAGRKKKQATLSPPEQLVLTSIKYITDNGPTQDPPVGALGVRQGTKVVRRSDVSLQASTTGLKMDGEKDASYRQRFGRAIQGLAAKQRIRVSGDALWLV